MRPKIIHPVKVILHRRKDTETDPEFGATGRIEWLEPVELFGQVKYEKFEQLTPVSDGNDPLNDGHIVFYADEWQDSGGSVCDELELEDSSRLIVIEVRPAAHYRKKYYHVHVYFSRKRTR